MPETKKGDYYTVAQAAAILEVSTTTVWRWIKAELLPAYRAGPKNIRIKKQDLERVITPAREPARATARSEEMNATQEEKSISPAITIRPLTDEEVQRGLAALERARTSRAQMLAEHGGKPLASSAPMIRQARAQRSRQLL